MRSLVRHTATEEVLLLSLRGGHQAWMAVSSLFCSPPGGWGQVRMKVPSWTGGRQEPAALGRIGAQAGELKWGAALVGSLGVQKNGADPEQ